MEKENTFNSWLLETFLKWQVDQKSPKSYADFAEFLGVSQPTITYWIKGTKTPSKKNAFQLAEKLGYRVYDELGYLRPDEDLIFITKNWDHLSVEEKEKILSIVKKKIAAEE